MIRNVPQFLGTERTLGITYATQKFIEVFCREGSGVKIPLGKSGRKWEDNIKIDKIDQKDGRMWTRHIWLCIDTSVGLF
jgi:hypothetical protein